MLADWLMCRVDYSRLHATLESVWKLGSERRRDTAGEFLGTDMRAMKRKLIAKIEGEKTEAEPEPSA